MTKVWVLIAALLTTTSEAHADAEAWKDKMCDLATPEELIALIGESDIADYQWEAFPQQCSWGEFGMNSSAAVGVWTTDNYAMNGMQEPGDFFEEPIFSMMGASLSDLGDKSSVLKLEQETITTYNYYILIGDDLIEVNIALPQPNDDAAYAFAKAISERF